MNPAHSKREVFVGWKGEGALKLIQVSKMASAVDASKEACRMRGITSQHYHNAEFLWSCDEVLDLIGNISSSHLPVFGESC